MTDSVPGAIGAHSCSDSYVCRVSHKRNIGNKRELASDTPFHTVPDVGKHDCVIGILNVRFQDAGPDSMAYQVHDFFAFKSFFGTESNDTQTWMSLVKPTDVIECYGLGPYEQAGCLEGKNPLRANVLTGAEAAPLTAERSPHNMLVDLIAQIQCKSQACQEA